MHEIAKSMLVRQLEGFFFLVCLLGTASVCVCVCVLFVCQGNLLMLARLDHLYSLKKSVMRRILSVTWFLFYVPRVY